MTVARAIEPTTALEDDGLEKQIAKVAHLDAIETSLTLKQQKRLM